MEEFLNELNEKFVLDDFTGHLAFLLADRNTAEMSDEEYEETFNEGLKFLQEILDIAIKHNN